MADIKIKKKENATIKTIDRTAIMSSRIKNNIVDIKDKTKESYDSNENSSQEYAQNRIQENTRNLTYNGMNRAERIGRKSVGKTKENIIKGKEQAQQIKNKIKSSKALKEKTIKTANKDIKNTKKVIKTADRDIKTTKRAVKATKNSIKTAEETIKKSEKIAKATKQMAQKTAQATQRAIKETTRAVKVAIRTIIATIKAIIAATKALVLAIIAGGWIAIIIIVVVVLIALICGSVFGIFFASEDTGSSITIGEVEQATTMNQVIADLNKEFMNKITQIQKDNTYEEYEISSNRAEWKDILAIYSVKINGGNNENEVLTLNNERVELVKEIFWEMNEITYSITGDEITSDMTYWEFVNAKPLTLHITISGKSVEDMAKKYNFNKKQMEQLEEIRNEKYATMWNAVIYGISVGSSDIVAVAESQIGNVGGQPYWSWYGFKARVEWCACFVSWCANECGYIEAGIIPKFAGCQNEGVDWFKACNLWKDRGFAPKGRRYYIL